MKLKKGKYYIGDPCYIFGKSWVEVLNSTNFFGDVVVNVFNKECIAGNTAHGDGVYFDNYGLKYFVDSGTIGCFPISLLAKDNKQTIASVELSEGMHIVNFKEDFEASIDKGVFVFGDIIIDTLSESEDIDDE